MSSGIRPGLPDPRQSRHSAKPWSGTDGFSGSLRRWESRWNTEPKLGWGGGCPLWWGHRARSSGALPYGVKTPHRGWAPTRPSDHRKERWILRVWQSVARGALTRRPPRLSGLYSVEQADVLCGIQRLEPCDSVLATVVRVPSSPCRLRAWNAGDTGVCCGGRLAVLAPSVDGPWLTLVVEQGEARVHGGIAVRVSGDTHGEQHCPFSGSSCLSQPPANTLEGRRGECSHG